MSETAKKEWNVGDTVWVAMRNPEARTDYVVYQGVVENKKELSKGMIYYNIREMDTKALAYWFSCPYGTEREAVEYALEKSVESMKEWVSVVKKLTDRLNVLTVSKSNTTQTPVQ